MVLLTIPIALSSVLAHVANSYQPTLQRLVIRVLWMPIIFGVDNWMALRYKGFALYWTALTGWYEAWVVYSFYCYLEAFLEQGSPRGSLARLPVATEAHDHPCMMPCCCLRPWRMADGEFVRKCKVGVLQYALVQTCCTAVTFSTQFYDKYHDGALSTAYAYMYVTVAVNVSQITALYCLVLFYHAFKEPLQPLRPLSKFMCVKLVIFFSFWQSMVITALVHFHKIRYSSSWGNVDPHTGECEGGGGNCYTVADVADGIQQFLMCGEMLIAAVAHLYAFPVSDYEHAAGRQLSTVAAAAHMLSCSDAASDTLLVIGCTVPAADAFGPPAEETAVKAEAEAPAAPAVPRVKRKKAAKKAAPLPPSEAEAEAAEPETPPEAAVECGTQMLNAGAAAFANLSSIVCDPGPSYPYGAGSEKGGSAKEPPPLPPRDYSPRDRKE